MGETHFSGPLIVDGVPLLPSGAPITGKVYFVDYLNGSDSNPGTNELPFKTILNAYNMTVDGQGDVIYLKSGTGATTYTHRMTAALDWANHNTHLIGLCAPTGISQRARISETAAVAAAGALTDALITVSAENCIFANVQVYKATTVAASHCIDVTGNRNYFENVHFAGIAGALAYAVGGSASRSLYITGGENLFKHCTIGIDTVSKAGSQVELAFASNAPRNRFEDCEFLSFHTAAGGNGALFVSIPASGIDRTVVFKDCLFNNPSVSSGGLAMTAAMSVAATAGGAVILCGNTIFVGCTDISAGSPTNIWCQSIDGASNTVGLAQNPTAS